MTYFPLNVIFFKPYGVNYAGASYKFTIQDTFGERRATAGKPKRARHRLQGLICVCVCVDSGADSV
jgi:hypothetical protein